jgi:hypothetical protein
MARGLDAGKYFWRSGREKCFSLDVPFNRISGQLKVRDQVSHPLRLTQAEAAIPIATSLPR